MITEKIIHPSQLMEWKSDILANRPPVEKTVVVSSGTCGQASGSLLVIEALQKELEKKKLKNRVEVKITGCHGFCELEPNLIVYPDETFYKKLKPGDIPGIVEETLINDRNIPSLVYEEAKTKEKIFEQKEIPFYKKQAPDRK
jgi:NADH-quinone oxidoreductase subunit F